MNLLTDLTIEHVAIPFIKASRTGYIVECNQAAQKGLGVTPGKKFLEIFTKNSFDQILRAFDRLEANKSTQLILDPINVEPTTQFYKGWHATCQKLDGKMMLIALVELGQTMNSIVESRKAISDEKGEIEANYQEAKAIIGALQNLFKAFPQNTIQLDRLGHYQVIKDDNNHMIFHNNKRTGLFWEDLRSSITQDIWNLIRESQLTNNIVSRELLIKIDNENHWVKVNALYGLYYSFISYSDISNQKKQLEKLVHDERLSTIGVLAGGLAHQYNNLHHALLALISEAKENVKSPQARSALNSAASLIEKGSTLSQSLLTHLRKAPTSTRDVPLAELFQRVELLVKDEMIKLKCKLIMEANDCYVRCNPTALDQVLVNLIINGGHACLNSERDSLVTVKAEKLESDKMVKIVVSDNGSGIPEHHVARLFTPLFSTKGVYAEKNSNLSKIKGTGLGLSLAKQLVEEQNGSIHLARTSSEKGTSFFINIPMGKKRDSKKAKKKKPVSQPGKKFNIYIIDDSVDNRQILKVYFKKYAKNFAEQSNGIVDDKKIMDFNPDLIFVDWLMPEYSGHDFLNGLKKDKNLKHLLKRTVILSGLDSSLEIDQWKKSVKAVLRKPVSQRKLIKLIGE